MQERLLAEFMRNFPPLAPLLRFHEMSTPLTQRHLMRTPDGAMSGLLAAAAVDAGLLTRLNL